MGGKDFQVFSEGPCLSGPKGLVLVSFLTELPSSWDRRTRGIYQHIDILGLLCGSYKYSSLDSKQM